jgi:phosphate transport system permease protein
MNEPTRDTAQLTASLFAPRPLRERLMGVVLLLMAFVSVGTTAGIVYVLVTESWAFFAEVGFAKFLLDTQWTPLYAEKHFGIWPLITGTLLTTTIAIVVALPLGLLAAIYLSEFASARARAWLKPGLEVLAGVPTVVYGYFALIFITPVLKTFIPGLAGFNAISPGIVMGLMIIPVIASLSEDALFAVPRAMREGSYALGASKLATSIKVVVPTAFSGIAAASILGVSRAIGETMIVAIAAGQQPNLTLDPTQPVETMTAYIVQISLGDTPTGTTEYRTIFAVGMTLFVMTLVLNLLSQRLRSRILKGATA